MRQSYSRLLLSLVFVLTTLLLLTVPAYADGIIASGTIRYGLNWELEGTTLRLSGDAQMQSFSSYEPAPWSEYAEIVTQLEIGDEVESIGAHAFENFTALTELFFPDSVFQVESSAFQGCTSLQKVTFSSDSGHSPVSVLGVDAFANCPALTEVIFYTDGFPWNSNPFYQSKNVVVKGYNRSRADYYAHDIGVSWQSLGESPKCETIRLNAGESPWYYIDDHKTIILADGIYNTTIHINNLCDVTILAEHTGKAEILSSMKDRPVTIVENAYYVNLSGMIMGHQDVSTDDVGGCGSYTVAAYSNAGSAQVVTIASSHMVNVENCDLWGCGLNAVYLQNASEVTVKDSILRDCVYGAIYSKYSQVLFENCIISGCSYHEWERTKPCIYANGYYNSKKGGLTISGCGFYNNFNPTLMDGSLICPNSADTPAENKYVSISVCVFHDNAFDGEAPKPYGVCIGNGTVWEIIDRVVYLGQEHVFDNGDTLPAVDPDVPDYSQYSLPWKNWEFDSVNGWCKVSFSNYGYYLFDPETNARLSSTEKLLRCGENFGALPEAVWNEDCEFLGWWTQKSGGEQITDSSQIPEDAFLTLYARWKFGGSVIGYRLGEDEEEEYETALTWELKENGTLFISGEGDIPNLSSLDRISQYAEIKRIVFGEGITRIDGTLFYGLDSLTEVYLPVTLSSIGRNVFEGSDSLSDVYYAGSEAQWNAVVLDTVGHRPPEEFHQTLLNAVMHCSSAYGPSMILPSALIEIGGEAFSGVNGKNFRLPGALRDIDQTAFDSGALLWVPAGSAAEEAANALGISVVPMEED